MVLKCLGSGSSGNCYLLENQDEVLIIEAGIPFADVKKALRWNLKKVSGCLISHEHQDHAKYTREVLNAGIRTLALREVFDSQPLRNRAFCMEVVPKRKYQIGGFRVFTLDVAHDVPCLGFVIEHEDMGTLLFVTDTMMLEYRILNLNHIMIECNYSDEILESNISNGLVPASMRDRLLHSHMELETTKECLRANNLSNVSEVILIHLSGNNSHEAEFCKEIAEASGKPTYAAKSGFSIELGKTPY